MNRQLATLLSLVPCAGLTLAQSPPTAELTSPLEGGVVSIDDPFDFIDVSYIANGTDPILTASVIDAAPEFGLSGTAVGTVLTFGSPTLLSGMATYRYPVVGAFSGGGSLLVDFAAGGISDTAGIQNFADSQSFSVTTLDADPSDLFLERDVLNGLSYFDVRFTSDSALSVGSIIDFQPEFQLGGLGAGSVVLDGSPTLVAGDTMDALYRYSFTGQFNLGNVTLDFVPGGFTDFDGSQSPTNIETIQIVPEPSTAFLAGLALLGMARRRRRVGGTKPAR